MAVAPGPPEGVDPQGPVMFKPSLALAAFPDAVQMACRSTPGLIWQGPSGGSAWGKLLRPQSCWNKDGELQTKAHGVLLRMC